MTQRYGLGSSDQPSFMANDIVVSGLKGPFKKDLQGNHS